MSAVNPVHAFQDVPALELRDAPPCPIVARGANQTVELVVEVARARTVAGLVGHSIGGAHLVAGGAVGVADHAAVGPQLLHEVAAGVPDLAADMAERIDHRHLPAQRVVVDPGDAGVALPSPGLPSESVCTCSTTWSFAL